MPKLLDRNFVIGFFLPALLAVFGAAWAFPNLSLLDPVRNLSAGEKSLGDLTYLGLAIWVLAVLLMTSNRLLYGMLEGYLPPSSWLIVGRWCHRRRFERLKIPYDELMEQWQTATDNGQDFPASMQAEAAKLRRTLVTSYPSTRAEIMPTRFGNVIRSFEVYPNEVYGVDSVTVWLRLASVIPKDYTALLDDARAQADCFVNLTLLALLIGLASLAAAGYEADWRMIPDWNALTLNGVLIPFGRAGLRHVAFAAGSVAFAAIFYWRAIDRASAWADLVRSAFDCYLPALIKQLGYAVPPTDVERREFWGEFSALITYERPMTPDRWPLASEVGAAKEKPESDKGDVG
ncbi:MAG TPA: hypothetical protein VJ487_16160 [Alphaproteobacteria bacterium]|nr:hypothetical protein [Alphaproteobacteria bacterium]